MHNNYEDTIKVYNKHSITKYQKLLLLILSIGIAIINVFLGKWLYAFVGLIMAYLATVNKRTHLTKNAIIIVVTALFYEHKQHLEYKDFDSIEIKKNNAICHIYFLKSNLVREIKFDSKSLNKFDGWIKTLGLKVHYQ